MTQFNYLSLADTYGAGERARLDAEAQQRRNALADLERSYLDQRMQHDQAAESRAATQFEQQQQAFQSKQKLDQLNWAAAGLAEVAQNPAAAERWAPEFQRAGILRADFDWRAMQPQELQALAKQQLSGIQAALASLGGQQPYEVRTQPGPQGSSIVTDGRRFEVVTSPRPPATPTSFRALTPAEIQAAGLPPGTSAQLDTATGKIEVLSKRDTTGGLSQKDATTAKMKLNTVSVARRQLANIRNRFAGIRNSVSAGPFGQGKIPTEGGRAFDRAVDQMRSTLTALTRVPGVGAMSDYETKLDQAKFPTRNEYESVTEQQIADLDNMLNAIEAGYRDLLNGTGPQATPDGEAALGDDEAIDFAALPRGRGATGGW